MKILGLFLLISISGLSFSSHASRWVEVDCRGQAEALIERVKSDEEIALTKRAMKRLEDHSVAVCLGKDAEGKEVKKKKHLFDFGGESDNGKKAGNKRLDKF